MAIASPVPTKAPDAAEVALRLAARQNGIQTCGWVNADYSSPATCAVGSTCAVNTAYDVHYCCPEFPCTIPTACIDSAAALTACDSDCQNNPLILKCTGIYSACYTRHWSQAPVLSGFGCAPAPFTQTVWTTNLAGLGKISYVSTFGLTVAQQIATTPGTSTNVITPSATTASSGTQSTQSTGGSSISGGAIAGIAVASAFVVLGLLLLICYVRRRTRSPGPQQGQPLQSQPQPQPRLEHPDPSIELEHRTVSPPIHMGYIQPKEESLGYGSLPVPMSPSSSSELSGRFSPRPMQQAGSRSPTLFSESTYASQDGRGEVPDHAALGLH